MRRLSDFGLLVLYVGVGSFVLAGCGKSSSGTLSFPAIAPLVAQSLPNALNPTHSFAVSSENEKHALLPFTTHGTTTPTDSPSGEMTNAATYIQALFTNSYNNSDNGQATTGLLNMLVTTIDLRMAGINSQVAGSSSACLSGTPSSYTIDLSTTIDPMLNLTLSSLQCTSLFSNNTGNSGVLFGQNGTNYSLQMSLGPLTGTGTNFYQLGGFFAAANVSNYGSTSAASPETVDGLLVAYQTGSSASPQMWVARFKANATSNTFELFFAANEPDIEGATAGTPNGLGAGFRMISDGTYVYADGILYDPSTGVNPYGTYYTFNSCNTATGSTVTADANPADCTNVANAFTLNTTASLNFGEVTGYPTSDSTLTAAGDSCLALTTGSLTNSSTCIPTSGPPAPVALSSVFGSSTAGLNYYFNIENAGVPSL